MGQFQKLLLSAATIFWLNSGQTLKTFRYLYVIFMLRIFVFFFLFVFDLIQAKTDALDFRLGI